MTTFTELHLPSAQPPAERDDAAQGWYLYGITRGGFIPPALAYADAEREVERIELAELVAVVRRVALADFTPAVLQERLRNPVELELMVRDHNRVIEAIHARQAILPAKFGMVYVHRSDIASALQSARDRLVSQLDRLDGCDEWAVHLYADRIVIRERLSLGNPAIQRIRRQSAAARPGRAYFLEKELHAELERATDWSLAEIAQRVHDRLAALAPAARIGQTGATTERSGEVEILRAAFLVARGAAEQFEWEVDSAADPSLGLRCEWSGPWPPYSFAAQYDEEAP